MNVCSIIKPLLLSALTAVSLSACFTGVESTPRIDAGEVRRNRAATPSDEQQYLHDIQPLPPRLWLDKKQRLRIDDSRITRIATPGSINPDSVAPREVVVTSLRAASSLFGQDATDITMRDIRDGSELHVRIDVPYSGIDTLERLEIPFTIDLNIVARTDSALRGRRLYVATDRWYDAMGQAVSGLRHIAVQVDSVVPGTFVYPVAVFFTPTDASQRQLAGMSDGDSRMMYLSVGDMGASSRSFDTAFSFEDPRKRYPEIEDDVWQLIMRGKVQKGMTRTECRLALGAPTNTQRVRTNGIIYDNWSYPDGVYLQFSDGYLTRFRL